jgi:hypothetical protein
MRKQAFDLQELASRTTQHALSQLGDLKQIRERPFEILLKYIVPGLFLLKGKWLLSLLFGVSEEVLGIGPSTIGAWIDKAIGKGPNSNAEPVSESSLEAASKGMVDRIVGGVFSKSSAFRAEIEKYGTIDTQALIVAWAHGPDKIEKAAIGTLATKFRSLLGMNGYATKGLLSGALFQLLKALLVGVGIHTGTGILFGGIKDKTMPFGGKSSTPGTLPIAAPGMRLYTNPVNNVAQSLVMALDNAITDNAGKSFSRIFTDLKGYSPVNSPEMGRVLTEVQAAHGGASIQEIGGYKTFAAPPLAEIAKTLLPQATYTKQTTEQKSESMRPKGKNPPGDAERELEGIFGGPR